MGASAGTLAGPTAAQRKRIECAVGRSPAAHPPRPPGNNLDRGSPAAKRPNGRAWIRRGCQPGLVSTARACCGSSAGCRFGPASTRRSKSERLTRRDNVLPSCALKEWSSSEGALSGDGAEGSSEYI